MTEPNIYDTANQLERDIRQLSQFKELVEAFEAVRSNQESRELFDRFVSLSQQIQTQQMSGQDPDEELLEELRGMTDKVGLDENISNLILKEQIMGTVINDLNRIITQPLSELYNG